MITGYRTYYNERRPHSALRYLYPLDYRRGDPAAARQAYWEAHRQP